MPIFTVHDKKSRAI